MLTRLFRTVAGSQIPTAGQRGAKGTDAYKWHKCHSMYTQVTEDSGNKIYIIIHSV